MRFSAQGSTLVEVEAIDANNVASVATNASKPTTALVVATKMPVTTALPNSSSSSSSSNTNAATTQFFIQAGAFKNETNADALMQKIQGLDIEQNAGINSEYNSGLYRLKLGPYSSRQEADKVAAAIRAKLNTSAIIINQ